MPDLSRFLRPRSIAVIGGGWGAAVVEQCGKMGFEGPVWAVHPKRAAIGGMPTVARIEDLPGVPDAVFIGINRYATVEAVRVLSALGAGGVVCFASGFAEAADDPVAGRSLQEALVAAAGDMPILGPNCYGLINYLDGALLWPDQHGGRRVERGVAILGQSSNVLINLTMQRRGLPVAYLAAAGNQAQTGLADLALAMLEDPRVSAVGLHIEGISDIRAFEALAARARTLAKPVVALKVGRSAQAQAATLSHTASLAGGDAASRAFLARIGVPVLASLSEFLETLVLAHVHGALPGRAIGSISCSGGEASLMADAGAARRVAFPALTGAQHDRVKATLSDLVTVANPLDYHTFIWGDVPRMTACYTAMMSCGFDLTALVYDEPRADRCSPLDWACATEALVAAQTQTGARAALVSSLPENLPEAQAGAMMAAGVAPLRGLEEALAAAEAMADLGEAWAGPLPEPVLIPGAPAPPPRHQDLGQAGEPAHPPGACAPSATVLDEAAAKAALAGFGVRIPLSRRVESAEDAATAAVAIGFPVVLKGLGIAHKTEAGAVRLGLRSAQAVVEAAKDIPAEAFLVEEMVAGAVAELIVGVVRDPVYGLTLSIGAGGILAELLQDTATLMVPSSPAAVRDALGGLRVSALLSGWRGKPGADLDAVVDQVMAVQAYAVSNADVLLELDVNPLIATETGAIAVDALIRLSAAAPHVSDMPDPTPTA
ncbi:MAG: acetate--CoA ligase family protein [Pseudomonadota bacterium]